MGGPADSSDARDEDGGDKIPEETEAEEKVELEKKGKEVKEEEVVVAAAGDSGGEEEEGESDDPDRLWCICHQPHDDRSARPPHPTPIIMISFGCLPRFMICCDQCEEWYHGSCVGISVSQGKRMEREGRDYTCPICVEKERQVREQREMNRYLMG